MLSQNCKLVFSIISSVFLSFATNSIFSLSNITIYILSYHQYTNPNIFLELGYIVIPIITSVSFIVTPLLKVLLPIFDFYLTIAFGSLINIAATVLLYFSPNVYVTYAAFMILGLGLGISANLPMRNACNYSERKGLIASIIVSAGFISSSIFTYVSEKLVNPNKVPRPEGSEFFPMEVAKNIRKYYQLMFVCIISATILCLLTLFKYKPPQTSEDKVNQLIETETGTGGNDILKVTQTNAIKNNKPSLPLSVTLSFSVVPMTSLYNPKLNYKTNLKKILGTFRIWKIALMRILTTYSLILTTNTFKTLGTEKGIQPLELTNTVSITFFCIIGLGFCIGWITDTVSMRTLFLFINVFGACSCYLIPFALDRDYSLVYKILGACNIVLKFSTQVIILAHLFKVFTPAYFLEASAITNDVTIILEFFGSLFPVLVNKYKGEDYYWFPFYVGLGCNVLGFVVSLFEDEKPIDLKKLKKSRMRTKKTIEEHINDITNNNELNINGVDDTNQF